MACFPRRWFCVSKTHKLCPSLRGRSLQTWPGNYKGVNKIPMNTRRIWHERRIWRTLPQSFVETFGNIYYRWPGQCRCCSPAGPAPAPASTPRPGSSARSYSAETRRGSRSPPPPPGASSIGREEAPKHFFRRTAITSPHCQEFMVWRIFAIVTIFMSDLMLEFTLMGVF